MMGYNYEKLPNKTHFKIFEGGKVICIHSSSKQLPPHRYYCLLSLQRRHSFSLWGNKGPYCLYES